jgi:hypothetical protein
MWNLRTGIREYHLEIIIYLCTSLSAILSVTQKKEKKRNRRRRKRERNENFIIHGRLWRTFSVLSPAYELPLYLPSASGLVIHFLCITSGGEKRRALRNQKLDRENSLRLTLDIREKRNLVLQYTNCPAS